MTKIQKFQGDLRSGTIHVARHGPTVKLRIRQRKRRTVGGNFDWIHLGAGVAARLGKAIAGEAERARLKRAAYRQSAR
jgi:hypothetical protein